MVVTFGLMFTVFAGGVLLGLAIAGLRR